MTRSTWLSLGFGMLLVLGVLFALEAAHDLWEIGIQLGPPPRRLGTVATACLLVVGALGGLSNRTWGLLTCIVCGVTFAGVWAYGIAHWSFLAVPSCTIVVTAVATVPLWERHRSAFLWAMLAMAAMGMLVVTVAGPVLRSTGLGY